MKTLRALTATFLCILIPSSPVLSQVPAQDSEVIVMPGEDTILRWHGYAGRTYFIQGSDPNDHLKDWIWSPYIEYGNDEAISHECGATADKAFFRLHYTDTPPPEGVTLEQWDADGDGLSNALELDIQTNPLNSDTSGDGIPDGWAYAHGLDPRANNAEAPFQDSSASNLEAYQQGVQADPNATLNDKDGDLIDNEFDAVPNDREINWERTPEVRYVWIEQVDEVDPVYHKHQPRAVSKHGQILFWDKRSYLGLNEITDPKNLWNSASRDWVALPLRGSQEIDVLHNVSYWHYDIDGTPAVLPPGQHVFNFNAPPYELIDINDEGVIYGVSIGVTDLYIDHLIPGMTWKRAGSSLTDYAAPSYFYPQYPFPASGGQSIVNRSFSNLRTEGAIANDGTINSYALHHAAGYEWMTYDSTAFDSGTPESAAMRSVRSTNGGVFTFSTYPGGILDKDRALFVEAAGSQQAPFHKLWLKEKETQTDLTFMATGQVNLAELSLAPNLKDDEEERLWITTGDKVFLERREGGSGEARWHQPPSMAEGVIRVSAQGVAITAGDPTASTPIPPKLWRNGEYTDLNDEKLTSKPEIVTITRAIDIASNGIILAQAVDDGVTKTGLLLPVEVIIPKLDSEGNEIAGKFMGATELKVAKWENAFTGNYQNPGLEADFISLDVDRFYINIPGGTSLGVVSANVSTVDNPDSDYDDPPHPVSMYVADDQTSAWSDYMILVADEVDNEFSDFGAGVNDQLNDRTHLIQLGGNLKIDSIKMGNRDYEVNLKIPVRPKKHLEVDFIRMNVENTYTIPQIEEAIKVTKELYAQVGVKIIDKLKNKEWPEGLTTESGILDIFDTTEQQPFIGPLTQDYFHFIDSTDNEGVNMYFIRAAYPARGISITMSQLLLEDSEIEMKYFNKAFINSVYAQIIGNTPAHELCHILAYRPDGGDEHDEFADDFWNLMSVETAVPYGSNPVFFQKRINRIQEKRIHEDPSVQNP